MQLIDEALKVEQDAIGLLRTRIQSDPAVTRAIALLLASSGRVIVSGMGKSGHIARKIAATLSSTGTPAIFIHPGEAAHGDLGMLIPGDVLIALSNSGESSELIAILPAVKRMGVPLIAMTGNSRSSLAAAAEVHLDVSVTHEAGNLNLAPTASTTVALALGDALAVTLVELLGFSASDFAQSHPSGALGRRLLTRVCDVMRTGNAIPTVGEDTLLPSVLLEMSSKGMGMTAIVNNAGIAVGIFTDGDLRRLIEQHHNFMIIPVSAVMHPAPHCINEWQMAIDAVRIMEELRINQLLVIDDEGRLTGSLHIHDLTRAKII